MKELMQKLEEERKERMRIEEENLQKQKELAEKIELERLALQKEKDEEIKKLKEKEKLDK